MTGELSPSQRKTPESIISMPEMRVYPLGYTPDMKHLLSELGINPDFLEDADRLNVLNLLTEEEIAVVLAKVSRNAGGFLEIAEGVSEEGAAQFHQKWVVSVEGYGHASVAEHAMIHMAVENVSSLAGDEGTDNRLASFTEFSARFKGRQNVGYYTPSIVEHYPDLAKQWHLVHTRAFGLNDLLMEKGLSYIQSEEGRRKHPERRVDGAKGTKTVADQVKNLMPASRLTSFGATLNAREAEHAAIKFLSSPYEEVREMGATFKEQSLRIVPTLVKYANANKYLILTRNEAAFLATKQSSTGESYPEIIEEEERVRLLEYDPQAESKFIAAALYRYSARKTYSQLLNEALSMSTAERREAFEILLGNLGKHDVPIRMLEFAGDYKIEIPAMTYGDWREWKRHRMETYDAKDLSVEYGYMIPELAFEMDASKDPQYHGTVDATKIVMSEIGKLFQTVQKIDPFSAHYCVTRFHYRPAIVKMNLREAFHLLSLRTGPTAHPFIRRLGWAVYDQIKTVHPLFIKHLERRLFGEGRPTRDFTWTY